ncbi:hypothetical protein RJZ90_005606 [Blastomyces dermatitidis]
MPAFSCFGRPTFGQSETRKCSVGTACEGKITRITNCNDIVYLPSHDFKSFKTKTCTLEQVTTRIRIRTRIRAPILCENLLLQILAR